MAVWLFHSRVFNFLDHGVIGWHVYGRSCRVSRDCDKTQGTSNENGWHASVCQDKTAANSSHGALCKEVSNDTIRFLPSRVRDSLFHFRSILQSRLNGVDACETRQCIFLIKLFYLAGLTPPAFALRCLVSSVLCRVSYGTRQKARTPWSGFRWMEMWARMSRLKMVLFGRTVKQFPST